MNIQAQSRSCCAPLRQLCECHRQIQESLRKLHDVILEAPLCALPPPYKKRLRGALDFLRIVVPGHMLDKELSLFPRLRIDPFAEMIISELKRDHQRLGTLFQSVETYGQEWLRRSQIDGERRAEFRLLIIKTLNALKTHNRIEEQRLFPLAYGRLEPEDLHQIEQEMASRRSRLRSLAMK